jgi:hypothetical protein
MIRGQVERQSKYLSGAWKLKAIGANVTGEDFSCDINALLVGCFTYEVLEISFIFVAYIFQLYGIGE